MNGKMKLLVGNGILYVGNKTLWVGAWISIRGNFILWDGIDCFIEIFSAAPFHTAKWLDSFFRHK